MFHMDYKVGRRHKTMLATTMEPTDARRLLPTWDEPSFRATFKLTVDLPASFKAYSNTPVEKQEKLDGGLQRIWFGVTPKMPSYLVVLVAGELERLSAKQDGVDIGIVTTDGKLASAAYPLAVTKDVLRYYNNYFGVPYPLAKLDQIAIPGGFNGAMENWGGIVYNESALLFDPKKSPERRQAGHLRRQRPRSGAPVVRQPGDHGLVGQPVAQRRLRLLDGDQGHRPFPSRVAALPGRPGRARRRDQPRRAQDHPPDPDPGR